ncbi:hypothetical protein E0500_002315 [Streptomyces sp. KM273126]|uniref:hypothetical protein n=1 Tax=Streptomyces sp. KM273126 TaxID=2545247 RepID=UPI00103F1075|nr:hypothetical protein [Streptomyces sp. KM273126]MBA2806323.1 hypothetical protein [Streptomyces sp. KM273126]
MAAVAAVMATVVLSGCQQWSGADGTGSGSGSGSGSGGSDAGTPAAAASPTRSAARSSGFGAVFLGVDECSSFGTTSFTEVPCTSERAAARVVARHEGKVSAGPACPATTDFVLHISEARQGYDEDGDGTVSQGYACMRKLTPPHPGDPGGGGGPRTIVGDCVYSTGKGEVRETSCDGEGENAPEYEVTSAVGERSECPASTALYVQLGGDDPVGCARPV